MYKKESVMDWVNELPRLILGAFGSVGFGIIYNINKKYLPAIWLGGFIAWLAYVVSLRVMTSMFMQALVSGFIVAVYAEIMARSYKAPSTIFFVASAIPLVPGKPLYECMNAIAEKNMSFALSKGIETVLFAIGIAGGMGIAWCICDSLRKIRRAGREKI